MYIASVNRSVLVGQSLVSVPLCCILWRFSLLSIYPTEGLGLAACTGANDKVAHARVGRSFDSLVLEEYSNPLINRN